MRTQDKKSTPKREIYITTTKVPLLNGKQYKLGDSNGFTEDA